MSRAAQRLRTARRARTALRLSWVCVVANGRQHDQDDMAVPAVPGPALVVVEAELVLGGFEAVLNGPALPFDLNQRFDARARWAPGGKERARAVSDAAPDQQAARP